MDCERIRELMWENELDNDALAHIEACPDCKKDYEIIKATRSALASKKNFKEGIMAKIKAEKRHRTLSIMYRSAAVVLLIFALGIFYKAIVNTASVKEDASINGAFVGNSTESESVTMDSVVSDGCSDTQNSIFDYAADAKDDALTEVVPDAEEPMGASPQDKEPPSHDTYMLLNEYKDMQSISQHTGDIIVAGDNIDGALKALVEMGAVKNGSHIEIAGDFYFEAQELLKSSGFTIVTASSAEWVTKTVIYFEDLLI